MISLAGCHISRLINIPQHLGSPQSESSTSTIFPLGLASSCHFPQRSDQSLLAPPPTLQGWPNDILPHPRDADLALIELQGQTTSPLSPDYRSGLRGIVLGF